MRRRRKNKGKVLIIAGFLAAGVFVSYEVASGNIGNRAKSAYNKGVKAYSEGDYEAASEEFSKAVNDNTENATYYIAYGMSLVELGEYDEAQEQFDAVISDKNNKITQENNKKAYRGKGICYFFAKNFEQAVKYFDMALEIEESDDLNLDILKYKADAQTYLGEYDDAIESLSKIIDEKGYLRSVYLKRAYAYGQNGNIDKAMADYEVIMDKDSDCYDAYIESYKLSKADGDEELGLTYLESAMALDGDGEKDAYMKAVLSYYMGDTQTAEDGLNTAVSNGYVEANFYLGKISVSDENWEDAKMYLEAYTKEEGSYNAEAYYLLGSICTELSESEDALEYYEKASSYNDYALSKQLLSAEIAAYERTGDFETASEKCEEYLEQYPDDEAMQKEAEFIKTRLL